MGIGGVDAGACAACCLPKSLTIHRIFYRYISVFTLPGTHSLSSSLSHYPSPLLLTLLLYVHYTAILLYVTTVVVPLLLLRYTSALLLATGIPILLGREIQLMLLLPLPLLSRRDDRILD